MTGANLYFLFLVLDDLMLSLSANASLYDELFSQDSHHYR